MANKTLLDCVNDTLRRVKIIAGDNAVLTTLTQSGKQIFIDLAVQVWTEEIEQLYSSCEMSMPNELGSDSITLVTGTRAYALAADMVQLNWPLLNQTSGHYIHEHPGGYVDLWRSQAIPANYTGQSQTAAIRPSDGYLYLDTVPTSDENGDIYAYTYDKDVSLSLATDMVPFGDAVYRALLPAVAEKWKFEQHNKFEPAIYKQAFGRAARLLSQNQMDSSWMPRKGGNSVTDPYAD